ncbi:MAG: DUF4097 family beta strand repeat-containing protein [Bacteroidales bacterium]|nr:DUF4097 family beta strand repeat-containing protein [Bacteroidales bacterium]
MKKMYKINSLFFLLAMMLFSLQASAEEHKKTFSESYQVNAGAEVIISNEYGNVNVSTWAENKVTVDITVTIKAKSQEKAEKAMEKVDVSISGNASLVKAITTVKDGLNCKNCEFQINCDVKMPASNQLELKNSFGNTRVGDLSGSADLTVRYGNLNLGKLENKENKIDIKFGDAEIAYLKAAELKMAYGALEIGKAEYLDLYARFTSFEVGEVSELLIDAEYESSEIGSVDVIRGKTNFHGFEIDELFDKMDLISTYGEISVKRVSGGFSLIDISNQFGEIELGISSSASYSLVAESSFGDIDFPESRAEVMHFKEEHFKSSVEAFIGNDKSGKARVIIKSKNGNIDIR